MTTMATRLPTRFAATTEALRQATQSGIILSMPPSINRLYRAVNGRSILSEAYRKWKATAAGEIQAQRPIKYKGPVSVTVVLHPKDKRRRDLDNAGFKAVLDLLVAMQIIEADDGRIVREIVARWADEGPECLVMVRPL